MLSNWDWYFWVGVNQLTLKLMEDIGVNLTYFVLQMTEIKFYSNKFVLEKGIFGPFIWSVPDQRDQLLFSVVRLFFVDLSTLVSGVKFLFAKFKHLFLRSGKPHCISRHERKIWPQCISLSGKRHAWVFQHNDGALNMSIDIGRSSANNWWCE